MAAIVLTAVGSVRNNAKVANIQATLRNAQTAGEIYYNSNNFTYAGICGDWTAPNTYTDSPIQQHIDALNALDSNVKVGCWVGQADPNKVGGGTQGSGGTGTDSAEREALGKKDWALTVYFNGNNYSVNPTGVVTFDTENAGGEENTENWSNAASLCAGEGKRLPSVSQLRALRMAHGDQTPNNSTDFGFTAGNYWSHTEYSDSHAWRVGLDNGVVDALSQTSGRYVRCVA